MTTENPSTIDTFDALNDRLRYAHGIVGVLNENPDFDQPDSDSLACAYSNLGEARELASRAFELSRSEAGRPENSSNEPITQAHPIEAREQAAARALHGLGFKPRRPP